MSSPRPRPKEKRSFLGIFLIASKRKINLVCRARRESVAAHKLKEI